MAEYEGDFETSKRKFCSAAFWKEESRPIQGNGLFHFNAIICGRVAAVTIERFSSINLVSIEVVEKLQLSTCYLSEPYFLASAYGALQISHQAEVPITIGPHTEVVVCDISPVALDSCHIMLGATWWRQFKASCPRGVDGLSIIWNMRKRYLQDRKSVV